jgi:hypothetical protein
VTLPYQNYITEYGVRKKSGRRKFYYCQHYWKYQGMESTLVSYLAYVGDTINAYITTVIIYHIYSRSIYLYRYGMHHTVYISMQGICHNTIIRNTTVQFVIHT